MFCIIFLLHPAATANPKESKDAVGNSATKTRKRSRPSPRQNIAKKLLLDEHAENEDDDCGHDTAKPRYALAINFK